MEKVEVLITTMDMTSSHELVERMNIRTDAFIGNQTDHNYISNEVIHEHNVKIFSFEERGVGLNRNNLLMRTDADYCLFGDDDLVYVDDYEKIVKEQFKNNPDADILIFNLEEVNSQRYQITQKFKVNYFNFMRFGAARVAIRKKSISLNAIYFNQNFGGGCQYSNGEDTLFLCECLKKKLNIYALPITIAKLTNERESSWFEGYTDKYFNDKGMLYYIMSKKYYKLLCLQDAIRHRKDYQKPFCYIMEIMLKGVKNEFKV